MIPGDVEYTSEVQTILFDYRTTETKLSVGARAEIFRIMVELAKAGKSIIMVSSDMPELISMSDRIGAESTSACNCCFMFSSAY